MKTSLLLLAALSAALSSVDAAEPELNIYFGNLHAHTSYSDGVETPDKAYAYARDVAKLDFLAITEHNHLMGGFQSTPEKRRELYVGKEPASLVNAAKRLTEDGKFVALYGQEFSSMSKGNHVNVFEVPEPIEVMNGAFHTLLEWMKKHSDSTGRPAVLQLNHPALGRPGRTTVGRLDYGRDDFGDDAGWVRAMGGAASLIELLNGEPPADKPDTRAPQIMDHFYLVFLQLGFRVAPTGNQDNHRANWGVATEARTAIMAPALTTRALIDAMRARRVYATEDRNLRVWIRVNGHWCGDILRTPSREARIDIRIEDSDEPEAEYTVEAFSGEVGGDMATIAGTLELRGDTASHSMPGIRLDRNNQYVFFRITQAGKVPDRAWTAPVWLETGSPSPTPVANPPNP
jgi:hypothetical protein